MNELSLWVLLPAAFVSLALFILLITAVSNIIFFPKLRPKAMQGEPPLLSVLVPARNEAAIIAQTVQKLLAQQGVRLELLVLDDHSEDETAVLAQAAAGKDGRFRLLQGQPLPTGWLGKNWACQQLGEAATGAWLLFCDADVSFQPQALAALVEYAQESQAGLTTVWPTQTAVSWGERLIVPLMKFAIFSYLPILPVHHAPWAAFAAANGQCLLFRREAYAAIGGHAAVRGEIVEDVALARRVKQHQQRLRMLDGNGMIGCRMYQSWEAVRDGFAKNMVAGHGNSPAFLLVSTLFHWLVFVWPWLWLLLGGGWWAAGLGMAGLALRGITAVFAQDRLLDVLLMPISVILMSRIAWQALRWHMTGKIQWKGRRLDSM